MTKVAFIGLGIMGSPMAANLLRSGFDVIGFNRSPAAVARLVAQGGRAAASVADAVADVDIVATMLPDTPDVVGVLTGPEGVFEHARSGTLVIDFSTIQPDAAASLSELAGAAGCRFLDAPVSGGEQGAIDGTLSVMAGGDKMSFAAASEVFAAVGAKTVHVGGPGTGQTVKAANQLVIAGTLAVLAEAVVFLEAHGVETDRAMAALGAGLAGSNVMKQKASGMLARRFTPGFRADLHLKDMGIVVGAARQVGVTVPVAALVTQLMVALNAAGHGAADHSALITVIEGLSAAGARSGD